MKTTDVVLILDVSGSMAHLQSRQEDAARAIVAELAKAEAAGQLYLVSVHTFGRTAGAGRSTPFRPATAYSDPSAWGGVKFLCDEGGTALLDAVGHAYTMLNARNPEAALVQVITDGGENCSRSWSPTPLGEAIKKAQAGGAFTFALTGPQQAGELLRRCGLPDDNFRPWDGVTEASYRGTITATTQAVSTFTQLRAKGVRSTTSYYVDPSKLNTAGVRSMAKKVTPSEVKTVSKRMDGRAIADFFTKFEKGKHYYQLIKPEYIDQDKDLVVHIKDKDEYRQGSRSVRILLGLPADGRIRVKPSPAASNFDVFIQSASVNRKLVEGQKLLTL